MLARSLITLNQVRQEFRLQFLFRADKHAAGWIVFIRKRTQMIHDHGDRIIFGGAPLDACVKNERRTVIQRLQC